MGWSIGFPEYQFTPNGWVLTCKNSYLEELIPRQKLEKPDFWENPHFHVFIITQLGWVLWKNSYLKVLPNYFLDHEKHFEYLQLVDTTKTKKYMRHRRSFENTKFVLQKSLVEVVVSFSSEDHPLEEVWEYSSCVSICRLPNVPPMIYTDNPRIPNKNSFDTRIDKSYDERSHSHPQYPESLEDCTCNVSHNTKK